MSEEKREYVYPVTKVERIVDGDTYWLHLDVGFRQTQLTCIRLFGYDTPEKVGGDLAERAAAVMATSESVRWFNHALDDPLTTVWVETKPDPDVFGRWLGEIYSEDRDGEVDFLGRWLFGNRLATEWPTRWREAYGEAE